MIIQVPLHDPFQLIGISKEVYDKFHVLINFNEVNNCLDSKKKISNLYLCLNEPRKMIQKLLLKISDTGNEGKSSN